MAINWTNNGTNNKWSENTTAIFEATGDLPSWVTSGQIDGDAYYVTSDGTTTKATGTNDGAVYSNGKLTITVNINMDINDWTVQVFGTNSSNVLRWPGFGAVSDPWADPGCQADDAESGDLTHRIIRTYERQQSDGSWSAVDKIDRSIEGTYRITYNVSDGRLSAEPVTRTVTLPKFIATPAALKGCGFTPASIEMLDDGQPRYRLVKRSEADDGEGWTMSGAIEHAESLGGSVACASTAEKHNQLALAYLSEFDKFVDTVDRDTRFWLGAPWNSNLGRYQWIDGLDPQFTYGYSIDASQDPDSSAFDDAGYTLGRYPCAVLDDVSHATWGKLGYILDRVPLDSTQEADFDAPLDPQDPTPGARAHFGGGLMNGIHDIFVEDWSSEFVGMGDYPDNTKAFPKAVGTTFDGIALDTGVRCIIYSEEDFQGDVVVDITGPIVVNNAMIHYNADDPYAGPPTAADVAAGLSSSWSTLDFRNMEMELTSNSGVSFTNKTTLESPLRGNDPQQSGVTIDELFPESVRYWSNDLLPDGNHYMQTWSFGSLKLRKVS